MLILVTNQINNVSGRKSREGKSCFGNCPMAEECQLNCPIFMCSIKVGSSKTLAK